ncbi:MULTISPECIES: D-alanyl-D-alanine carboxypeptidase [Prochlorococcus]|uniref:D-alanyl-D-alanine carboxypeptidase n=1 Tax=Prochlorococcus marinus (strain SARG / CCMP1375 / SS120) TaxID=167539 RepID=Q7VBZ1_PROMA|nr:MULTISPECIES: D-alanyl-D-alanine carboxypeptidase [Prochlorococcus]AAP99995.1 D-alanyl-D-alanine carboxypeptidase [Prochlorococcus marinus subsp. marinus str. CCMP1375]KGG13793.1 D-alanyl-D-alanine carboxypeptidase [Prochlorococcus marinus str. LG]KGG18928.1 D-alanyl-D-alanine carboxypeptidase [Prochlorococcus marinus str. SS2]KGG23534.1 D-alanyl-D-alanine carboxypeptidase [Prochlorococcus marinus str. SS35]KGG32230.1 D-alanyl-D-alanine carboxypeptidase [Prochlorococcus marinus str. SS51]
MIKKNTILLALLFVFSIILFNRYNGFILSFKSLLKSQFNLDNNKFTKKIHQKNICYNLQNQFTSILGDELPYWSITVLNSDSTVIAELNGNILRIPASNQKIFSSAYALTKKGPYFRLSTDVYKNSNGYYEILGAGDPDIDLNNISKISSVIAKRPFYTKSNTKIILYEENKSLWWPKTWSYQDRLESYGAPISRLAITSNANEYSVTEPLVNFSNYLSLSLYKYKIKPIIEFQQLDKFNRNHKRRLIYNIKSAPLYMLLNLSNSESHNFISEVLMRSTANTWVPKDSSFKLHNWLTSIGVNEKHIDIKDGSGLSRSNQTTTRALSSVLYYMKNHKYSDYFVSSMSLLGIRGTLRDHYIMPRPLGYFLGKSGTLEGVRSLSGYLYTDNKVRIVSIIQNNANYDETIFSELLRMIYNHDECI